MCCKSIILIDELQRGFIIIANVYMGIKFSEAEIYMEFYGVRRQIKTGICE